MRAAALPRYNRVVINVPRSEVVGVAMVDTDFVFTLRSGIRLLVRDGAMRAAAEPDFAIVFADDAVDGQALIALADSNSGIVVTQDPWGEALVRPGEATPGAVGPSVASTPAGASTPAATPPADGEPLEGLRRFLQTPLFTVSSAALGLAGLPGIGAVASVASTIGTAVKTVVEVVAVAGPFIADVLVTIYDAAGRVVAVSVSHDPGTHSFDLPGDLPSGTYLVVVGDLNSSQPDYVDERLGVPVDLPDGGLRALFGLSSGQTNQVSVTPLTEMAVRRAFLQSGMPIDSTVAPSADAVAVANQQIGQLFGLANILGDVVPVIAADGRVNTAFSDADGQITAAEHYGRVLAALSGLDAVTESAQATMQAFTQEVLRAGELMSDPTLSLVRQMLSQGANSFENSQSGTEGFADLGFFISAIDQGLRELVMPPPVNRRAAERATGASALSGGLSNSAADAANPLADGFVNEADLAAALASSGSVLLPVAIPGAAMAGDRLTLTFPAADGGAPLVVSRTLASIDLHDGYALVAMPVAGLRAARDGAKVPVVRVEGPAGSGIQPVEYPALTLWGGRLTIDTTAPAVAQLSISGTSGGLGDTQNPGVVYLNDGDAVLVTVRFDSDVVVSGSPRLKLEVGDADESPVFADPKSGSCPSEMS